jgi:hypothetical protein
MKIRSGVIALAVLGVVATDPALARSRHNARPHCVDRPFEFSWSGFWFNPPPEWNGCPTPISASSSGAIRRPETSTIATSAPARQWARAIQNPTASISAVLISDCGTRASASVAIAP